VSRAALAAAVLLSLPLPAAAQAAGLLLGVQESGSIYIRVTDDGRVSARSGPAYLIPRRDGFWRLQWLHVARCRPPRMRASESASGAGAVGLTVARLGSAGRLPGPHNMVPCHPEYQQGGDESVSDSIALRFIGTDHVWLAYHYLNEGASAQTRLFASGSRLLALDSIAAAGFAASEILGHPNAAPVSDAVHDSLYGYCERHMPDLPPGSRLMMLTRRSGRWIYEAEYHDDCNACNRDVLSCPVDAAPPRELTGFDSLTIRWSAITDQVPGALDAFTAPSGGLAVVRDSAGLQVFRPSGDRLGAPLARIPLPPDVPVIMIQWALGPSADRWERRLAPLLSRNARIR
jgi:hypothetical protein